MNLRRGFLSKEFQCNFYKLWNKKNKNDGLLFLIFLLLITIDDRSCIYSSQYWYNQIFY